MQLPVFPFPIEVSVRAEKFQLKDKFHIARHCFYHSQMMVVELKAKGHIGRGESEPHEYDENQLNQAVEYSQSLAPKFAQNMSIEYLNEFLPSGAIRNAFDCALWDLSAKIHGKRVWELLEIKPPIAQPTVYTLSIDEPEIMAQKAKNLKDWSRFKIKLGLDAAKDIKRVKAIREALPDAELIIDANGGWDFDLLKTMTNALADLGVLLIEQPLLEGKDGALLGFNSPVPLCADESCLDTESLPYIMGRYQYINIKLDKTGGLTEALKLKKAAEDLGLGIMVGCMAASSLAMAPAFIVAQNARFIDLDGPMLLANDRVNGMKYNCGMVYPPMPQLWG